MRPYNCVMTDKYDIKMKRYGVFFSAKPLVAEIPLIRGRDGSVMFLG